MSLLSTIRQHLGGPRWSPIQAQYSHEQHATFFADNYHQTRVSGFTRQQIAHYLRLPEQQCSRELTANQRFLAEVESRRTTQQSSRRLRRQLRKWHCSALQSYQDLIACDPRSRIIATFHFGDFVFGMNYLLRHEPVGRKCIVLTQRASDSAYFDNMGRAFADQATTVEQQWLVGELSRSRLARQLRCEQTTLVTFCDLPPAFGATTTLRFLGRRARFPRGAANLAFRCRLPILPVICCFLGGTHRLVIAPQLEPVRLAGESTPACISRLTREIVNLLQSFVQAQPYQWRFLGTLPAFFEDQKLEIMIRRRAGVADE